MAKYRSPEEREQRNRQILKNFRLMDDTFMTKCFEGDPACVELVLHIILNKPDLVVQSVRTQEFKENLTSRSVRLDILATDSKGRKYNIEVQRLDKGADPMRARYHCSVIDVDSLDKGANFRDLPELWVIFITENDVIGKNQPLYPVERCFLGTNELFHDGSHILYVNGSYQDQSALGRLMHDFFCTNPDDMYYDVLANRARHFKEQAKGAATMCRAMEELYNDGVEEGFEKGVEVGYGKGVEAGYGKGVEAGYGKGVEKGTKNCILLLLRKFPPETVAELINLPLDEVLQIQARYTE